MPATAARPPAAGSSSAAAASSAVASSDGRRSALRVGIRRRIGDRRTRDLEGITFVATEVTGAHTIVPGSTISLTFETGALSARAGCNNMFGQYTITGDVLNAPQLASTMMACDDAADGAGHLARGLPGLVTDLDLRDGTLTLTNGTDTIAMTEAPSGAEALEGPAGSWSG